MVQPVTTCPVDMEEGLARAGDEKDFYRELLEMFLEDVPQRIAEVRAAAAGGDPAKMAAAAHGIKGAAANLSAGPVRECAYAIEALGRRGSTDGADPLIAALVAEVERLAEFVKTF